MKKKNVFIDPNVARKKKLGYVLETKQIEGFAQRAPRPASDGLRGDVPGGLGRVLFHLRRDRQRRGLGQRGWGRDLGGDNLRLGPNLQGRPLRNADPGVTRLPRPVALIALPVSQGQSA